MCKKKAYIEIESCLQCQHKGERNQWSSDGWDRMKDWYCKKTDETIAASVEWHDESKIEIPESCPFTLENQNLNESL